MRLFVSYASASEKVVRKLVRDLRLLRHEVWFDEELVGGTPWWSRILQQIRQADAIVYAASRESARSEACRRELDYARALGVPVLPMAVDDGDPADHPPEVARLEVRRFTGARRREMADLQLALAELPARPALPDPLPAEPEPPLPAPKRRPARVRPAAEAAAISVPATPPANPPDVAPRTQPPGELALLLHLAVGVLPGVVAMMLALGVGPFTLDWGLTRSFVEAVRDFGAHGAGFAQLVCTLVLFGACWAFADDTLPDVLEALGVGLKGAALLLLLLWGVIAPLQARAGDDWLLAVLAGTAVHAAGTVVGLVRAR